MRVALTDEIWGFIATLEKKMGDQFFPKNLKGNSVALFAASANRGEESTKIDNYIISNNFSKILLAHNLIDTAYKILQDEKVTDRLDIGFVVKIPQAYQDELGEEVQILMGRDMGMLTSEEAGRLADVILNDHTNEIVSMLLLEDKKAKKPKSKR